MVKYGMFKVGTVALVGRPNTGKSTLVNALVGQKVSITSPKPQTTQFAIQAVHEDERGQIIFIDTPGIFAKTRDTKSKEVNLEAERVLGTQVDVILYVIDPTRSRGMEENRVLGTLRKIDIPKILVVNKIDLLDKYHSKDEKNPNYEAHYKFLEYEFEYVIRVSALKPHNIAALLTQIFELLPEGERAISTEDLPFRAFNLSSRQYIEENIREKAFLVLRREVPYQIRVQVDDVEERDNGLIYIKARIVTHSVHYKKMIIGEGAQRIKQISMMGRKELEVATGKKIYLELTVEVE